MKTCSQCSGPLSGQQKRYCGKPCARRAFYAQRIADGRMAEQMQKRRDAGWQHRWYTVPCTACGTPLQRRWQRQANRQPCCDSALCKRWLKSNLVTLVEVPWWHPVRSCPVPADHPARWRGPASCPVDYSNCVWCGQVFIRSPTLQLQGKLHCSRSCLQRSGKQRRRAREHNATGTYTWTEVIRLFILGDRRCAYCDLEVDGPPEPDHVIPLSRGGSNSIVNILPCCHLCNSDKSDSSLDEWAASRERRGLPSHRYVFDLTDRRFRHLVIGECRDRAAA